MIGLGASFVNVGPTDWNEPDRPKSERFVAVDEDIHGWSPFVTMHPSCYAQQEDIDNFSTWSMNLTASCGGR